MKNSNKNTIISGIYATEGEVISKKYHQQMVSELNKQLYEAYERIAQLTEERNKLKSGR